MIKFLHYYKAGVFFHQLPSDVIFVFGGNEKGAHGAGAAKDAVLYFGAVYGQAEGLQGQSYALPTKNKHLKTLPPIQIAQYVLRFLKFAREHPELKFLITPLGTGLAGISDLVIAPMFRDLPENCCVHEDWVLYLAHEEAVDTRL